MHLGISGLTPTLLYFGAIAAFFLSIFRNPRIGLYFLVPLLPMQTVRYWLHDLPLGEKLIDVLLLGVLLGMLFHYKKPIFVTSPVNKLIIAFCVLLYIALWEGSLFQGLPLPFSLTDARFSDWKNYVEMMIFFFVAAAAIRTPKQMQILVIMMCLSVLVVNRSYHASVGDRDFSQYSDALRDAGALGYAGENGMGAFQAEMAVFFIGLAAFSKKLIAKVGLWGITFTCIYSLLVTFSRGGYVGFLIGLLVIGLIKERKLLILLTVILVGWQGFVPNAVRERVLMTYSQGEGLDSSAEERIGLWQDALQVFNHNPVLGTGFDTYKFMGRVGPYQDTHNYYVKVLLELGFVGIALFLIMLGSAARMAWRLFRSAKDPTLAALGCALFAMIVCAAVVNFFGDRWTYIQVNGFFWVLLGLIARGLFIVRQEQEVPEIAPQVMSVASPRTPKTSLA